MEYVFYFVVILVLFDIESKVSKLKKEIDNKTKKISINEIRNLIGKNVCINIENENISNSYMFSPSYVTKGIIKDVSNEWILFEYETKKEIIQQYFKINDIISIDEVK